MKTIPTDLWLKPFAPPITCINTIGAECPRSMSLEQCMQQCENNPSCNAGYHVTIKDPQTGQEKIPSFCVPLVTFPWANSSLFNSLIPSTNPTPLSFDKGITSTVFYNEKKFSIPPSLVKYEYIAIGSIVYLMTFEDSQRLYMTPTFEFSSDKQLAQKIRINTLTSTIIGYQQRIGFGSVLKLLKDKSQLLLFWSNHKKSFEWMSPVFGEHGIYFYTRKEQDRYRFVNYGDTFQLKLQEKRGSLFLMMDQNHRLGVSETRGTTSFSFELAESPYNPSIPLKELSKTRGPSWKAMNEFIDRYFTSIPSDSSSKLWIVNIILFCGLGLLWILFLCIHISKKGGRRSKR